MPASKLSVKISVILLLAIILEFLAIWIIQNPLFVSLITLVVFGVIGGLINLFLKPITTLRHQLQVLPTNHYQANLPITHDEFGEINHAINQILILLNNSTGKSTQDVQLVNSERLKFNSILNAVDDGVIALDHENNLIMMNSAAEKLTGYTTAQILNKPFESLVSFQDNDGIKTHLDRICQPHDKIGIEDIATYNLVGKDPQKKPVKVFCSTIKSDTPSNLNCVLILHDVAKEVALQGIQIDFVSMASHELRTPLTSIIGYLSVFVDENKATLTKDQLDFLDRIMISAKQLGSLIENLLNVSKVERNALSVNTQSVNWAQTVTKSVEDNRMSAIQKNISVSLDPIDPNLPSVSADPVRIVEVINNLISNAINYTPQGGHIEVGTKVDNGEVLTYVKDNGVGIPKDAAAHLFTKFFRVQGALDKSSNSKGTGLGLYLSKSIIDLHHGRIWVESEVGHGSTFSFTLPIASNGRASGLDPIASQSALPAGLTLPSKSG